MCCGMDGMRGVNMYRGGDGRHGMAGRYGLGSVYPQYYGYGDGTGSRWIKTIFMVKFLS